MKGNDKVILMNDIFDENEAAQYMKSYMFIKGFAFGQELKQTVLSLAVARKLHDGQYRKDGTPYISHPLKVCTTLISYGIQDDITLSAALLHDVLEDCQGKLPLEGNELVLEYGLDQEILDIIRLLTKESGLNDYELSVYFKKIEENPKAALIKLADRLHNSSTLYTFSNERMKKYLRETSKFILPMASYCKKYYPEYNNAFCILKNNIEMLNSSMSVMLSRLEEESAVFSRLETENVRLSRLGG